MADDAEIGATAWGRLRRRKLVQWALAYAAFSWIALHDAPALEFGKGKGGAPRRTLRVLAA